MLNRQNHSDPRSVQWSPRRWAHGNPVDTMYQRSICSQRLVSRVTVEKPHCQPVNSSCHSRIWTRSLIFSYAGYRIKFPSASMCPASIARPSHAWTPFSEMHRHHLLSHHNVYTRISLIWHRSPQLRHGGAQACGPFTPGTSPPFSV